MRPVTGSLRRKLWVGFGGLLFILVTVSILSVVVLTRYSHTLEQVFRENYDSVRYCDGMKSALDDLHSRAQQMAWHDLAGPKMDPAVFESRFESNLQKQLKNVSLPGEKELTFHLQKLWQEYRARLAILDREGFEPQSLYRSELLPRYQELYRVAGEVSEMNMSHMVSVDGKVKRTLIEVRDALLILVIAGVVVALAFTGRLAARILEPLQALTQSARQIESGDLDLTVEVTSRDELGLLAAAFNSMASRLREFRRLDHEKLSRTQQTTQLAIDSLPDAVCVIGPNGVIEISNRTAADYFHIVPGARLGELKLDWLSRLYEQVMVDGKVPEPLGYKAAIQLFDHGNERFLLPRAVPIVSEQKRLLGVTVILVDVTGLRQGDELKSAFVGTVSHELRTPLTSVRMTVKMLADPRFGTLTVKQSRLLNAAQEDTERLYRIIDNLLNLSRLEAGRDRFNFCEMPVEQIVDQAVDPLRVSFAEKRIELAVKTHAPSARVMADPTCIGLAMNNLLTNAIKYTPIGGTVTLETRQVNDAIHFVFSNSGPAIPPQYIPRLFERFFRIPTQNGPGGAGLGLAITKEIVEAHAGSIAFQPAPNGDGSMFTIQLPQIKKPGL